MEKNDEKEEEMKKTKKVKKMEIMETEKGPEKEDEDAAQQTGMRVPFILLGGQYLLS